MVGPNKILTVSYGTFSCTLEGFDEPFDTMKAIAEYFRDLAAEDRYFGAEPPTPDAEMLHRIAEREIKRRVDAKIEDNGVILRPQIDSDAEGAAQAGIPAERHADVRGGRSHARNAVRAGADAAVAAAPVVPAAALAAALPADDAADDGAALSGISAKLQRIRAAVAQVRAFETSDDDEPVATLMHAPEETPEDTIVESERLAAEEAARFEAERAAAEEAARVEAERLAAEEAARVEAERAAAEEATRVEAERLAAEEAARVEAERLAAEEAARAVAPATSDDLADEGTTEAQPEPFRDADSDRLAAERRRLEESVRADIARRNAERGAQPAADAEQPAAPRRRVVVVRPGQPAAPAQTLAQTPAQTAAQPQAREQAAPGAAAPATEAARQAPERTDGLSEAALLAAVAAATPEAAAALAPTSPTPATEAAPQTDTQDTVRAALAAFADAGSVEDTAAARSGVAEDLADEDDDSADPRDLIAEDEIDEAAIERRVVEALGDTGLGAEDEAGLVAELAAVERDAEAQRRAERLRRAALNSEADASMDRLITEADSHLSGAEAQRRQSTISHLKAAVVATRADEEAGAARNPEDEERAEIARYRQDLERTVRRPAAEGSDDGTPRRPSRPQAQRTERPRNAQPPLVLVSEQRIDRPAQSEAEAVRPRRIATGALAMEELFDEDTPAPAAPRGKAFTDFVGPMHLTTLAELTEAAAAYVTHVEGLEEFTRPQVMRHVVATGQPMTRSRENLLRTFGTLMRQGTMQRSRRGQFELSRDSEFGEQARRFAQG